jgi:indolepyruvate ferredoxin oxidoreductase
MLEDTRPATPEETLLHTALDERLTSDSGVVYLPAMQALVRLPLEQARRDRAARRRVGTFITGYPGSPLAAYDLQLNRNASLLHDLDIRHEPAGNEEQAATALMGTQMLDDYPHSEYEGVVGFWYGKGPGIDRAGDALKSGNFAGTSAAGAVVVLSGEDHEAKSSSMPFQEDYAFAAAGIPILYPGSVAEIRRLGLHAIEMSRFSGCWVALKLVSQLCDAGETVDLGAQSVDVRIPELVLPDGHRFTKHTDFSFYPGRNIEHERHLFEDRHRAVIAYARANALDRTMARGEHDRLGIVTAGKAGADLRQALQDMGLDLGRLSELGIRLLDIGLVYPLDADGVRDFASGLEEVIVVEEKRGFLEDAVRGAVQPLGEKIRVVGKHDEDGGTLFPVHGGMEADIILERLLPRLGAHLPDDLGERRSRELVDVRARRYESLASRTPNFCSGCPHNTSTVVADGQIAWGGPGCGTFNMVIPEREVSTLTQYGGEGLPWIGLAPFTDRKHIVQNLGDGAYYHSSSLNIQWAVAAGVSMTFKLLYNGSVANTGAQPAIGNRGVAELSQELAAKGVARIVIATKDASQYRGATLGPRTEIGAASRIREISKELEATGGVTVLIYDESCANERRRQQKRGKLPQAEQHVYINTAVCENCGDCGAKSNCMSLQKVPTEFGAKTQIHGSSCNDDYSCLQGDCPSFVVVDVKPGTGRRRPTTPPGIRSDLPEPTLPTLDAPYHVLIPGVGGTGVITLNAVLAQAAHLGGTPVITYDQTGAAQKWGPVLSSLILHPPGAEVISNKVGLGRADLYLVLDEVGAGAAPNLDRCDPSRTAMVRNTDLFPTGELIRDVWHEVDRDAIADALARWTDPEAVVDIPARSLAEHFFGDYMLTNITAAGAAYQAGLLPIPGWAIEEAITLNGVAVDRNIQAFRLGRQWVADRESLTNVLFPQPSTPEEEIERQARDLGRRDRTAYQDAIVAAADLPVEVRRLLAIRVAELIRYQSTGYAGRYVEDVLRVADAERSVLGAPGELTAAVARGLHKVMAYKDEYEVARLHLASGFEDEISREFDEPVRIRYQLHPPFMRRLGRTEKISVGPWFRGVFRALVALRGLRGTLADPFRWQPSRREEREILTWYRGLLDALVDTRLTGSTFPLAVEIAELPGSIRGYEGVKSKNYASARGRASELMEQLERGTRVEKPSMELPVIRVTGTPS